MKTAASVGAFVVCCLAGAATASAEQSVIYAQGKGQAKWDAQFVQQAGWNDYSIDYAGGASMSNATENNKLKNFIATKCFATNSTTPENKCVIVCYSAGCMRTLKIVKELRDANPNNVRGLQEVWATASAAGGTRLAEEATTGSLKSLAKQFKMADPVDVDLRPANARGSGAGQWGYVQNTLGVYMHHQAGKKDLCKSFLIVKFCGNKYAKAKVINANGTVSSTIDNADVADGAVNMASAAGYAPTVVNGITQFNFTKINGCLTGKYTWRDYDDEDFNNDGDTSDLDDVSCSGADRDHGGMPGITVKNMFGSLGYDANRTQASPNSSYQSGLAGSTADCTGSGCDRPHADTCLASKKNCVPGHADWTSAGTCSCWNRALGSATYDAQACKDERANQGNWAQAPGSCTEYVSGLSTEGRGSPTAGNTSAVNSCQGRCGQTQAQLPGFTCGCAATGTQCSDYAAANCNSFQ